MITKKCLQCNKEFKVFPYRKDTANYCSISCSKVGKNIGNTNGFLKGQTPHNKGKKNPGVGGRKKGGMPWNKGIKYEAVTGSKNPNWKGGVTKENEKQRKSIEYKLWRTSVFERDNYTCVMCGCDESGKLNADHIKPFSLFPELRFAIDNGRTLCIDCHKKTDSYMTNIRKLEKLYLDK